LDGTGSFTELTLLLDELILELDEELEEDEALTTNEVPRLQNR